MQFLTDLEYENHIHLLRASLSEAIRINEAMGIPCSQYLDDFEQRVREYETQPRNLDDKRQ